MPRSSRYLREDFTAITPHGGFEPAQRYVFLGPIAYAVSIVSDICWWTRDGRPCPYLSVHRSIVNHFRRELHLDVPVSHSRAAA